MTNSGSALARAAEAMLRALGGTEVKLRCTVAAARDAQARQLGLDVPVTEDIAVSPVVVRASGSNLEVLIAPASMAQYLNDRGQTAEPFFQSVLAVLFAGREYKVTSFHVEQFAGADYLYGIELAATS